jgi:hypothetical protein
VHSTPAKADCAADGAALSTSVYCGRNIGAVAVVPAIRAEQSSAERDAAITAFRDSELRSRVWRTGAGERLLKWFWKSWLGLWVTRKFAGATAEELHGYAFWGPVALAVLVTELLGTGWFGSYGWPTISSTVGHLQDLNDLWGVPVVGLIGIAAFYAMAYETRPTSEGAKIGRAHV